MSGQLQKSKHSEGRYFGHLVFEKRRLDITVNKNGRFFKMRFVSQEGDQVGQGWIEFLNGQFFGEADIDGCGIELIPMLTGEILHLGFHNHGQKPDGWEPEEGKPEFCKEAKAMMENAA